MAFVLAGHLGKTVEEILEMSEREFRYWEVLHAVNPFGELREDWRNAQTVQAIESVIAGLAGEAPPMVKDCKVCFSVEDAKRRQAERLERKLSAYIKTRNTIDGRKA